MINLSNQTKNDIKEVRAFSNPPIKIVIVIEYCKSILGLCLENDQEHEDIQEELSLEKECLKNDFDISKFELMKRLYFGYYDYKEIKKYWEGKYRFLLYDNCKFENMLTCFQKPSLNDKIDFENFQKIKNSFENDNRIDLEKCQNTSRLCGILYLYLNYVVRYIDFLFEII